MRVETSQAGAVLGLLLLAGPASAQTAPGAGGSLPPPPPPAEQPGGYGQPPPAPPSAAPPPAGAQPAPYGPSPPAQQPGGYGQQPPPVYAGAPPPYGAAPPYGSAYTLPPAVLPYHEGQAMPPGYHVEERIRYGPFVTGLAIGGFTYLLSLAVAAGDDFDNAKGWLVVPVAGPWLTLAFRDGCQQQPTSSLSASCVVETSLPKTLLVFDGILQGTGALLVTLGVVAPRMLLVRDDVATVELVPMQVGGVGPGLGLVGRL